MTLQELEQALKKTDEEFDTRGWRIMERNEDGEIMVDFESVKKYLLQSCEQFYKLGQENEKERIASDVKKIAKKEYTPNPEVNAGTPSFSYPIPQPAGDWEERFGLEFGSFECLYTKRNSDKGDWILFDDIIKFFRQELKEAEAKKEPCAGWTETCGCYKQARLQAYEEIEKFVEEEKVGKIDELIPGHEGEYRLFETGQEFFKKRILSKIKDKKK